MLLKKKLSLTLAFTCLLSTNFAYAGGDNPTPIDPCDETDLVLSNIKNFPSNPMFDEYRPTVDPKKALNYLFYAVQEGRISTRTIKVKGKLVEEKYAEIPVYGWFEKNDGFDIYTVFQRQDYFDLCSGCYVGSCCQPVNYFLERTKFVPLKKWVPWQQVCKELDHPANGNLVKRKILSQIREENLYGLLRKKGYPNDSAFLDKYDPYTLRDTEIPDEEWMSLYDANGNPARSSSRRSHKATKTSPPPSIQEIPKALKTPIEEDPRAVEIVPVPPPPHLSQAEVTAALDQEEELDIEPPQVTVVVPPAPKAAPAAPAPAQPAPKATPIPAPPAPVPAPSAPKATPAVTPPAPKAAPAPTPSAPKATPVAAPTTPKVTPTPQTQKITPPPPAPVKTQTPPPSSKTVKGQYPVAEAVPGKEGWVYVPGTNKKIEIDVTGFPSGAQVRDPNTQTIFKVP